MALVHQNPWKSLSISWKLVNPQPMDWILHWNLRLEQRTGGLFNDDQEYMAGGLMGLTDEFATKEDTLDNPLASDDWLDMLAQNPYDCCDVFPESTNFQENSSTDKDINTSIAINFSEIMADLVNLMSLDKALDHHEELHGPSTSKLPSNDSTSSGKRPHDVALDDVSSSLPDHNYYSLHQKKPKLDDISASQNIPMTDKEPQQQQQQPRIVKNSKYFERRKKNNIASKRSRETRKHRFIDMEAQADQLEEENEKLRQRIDKLEHLTQQMKEVLVKRLSNSGR